MAILALSAAASTAARDATVDAIVAQIDGGPGAAYIEIRTGAKPATVATAASGTLLATVTLADPSFGASSAGTATGTDPASVVAVATGTAGWFRTYTSAATAVMDGDATATGDGGTMELSTLSIVSGGDVDITALSITMPA